MRVMADVSPQDLVAADYMARKGYPGIEPVDVEPLDGQPCWYYVYELTEGTLELEIFWNEKTGEWETMVTTFTLAG